MSMNKRNFQKELDDIIASMDGRKKLLLHSCCAPCSSYCLEYLTKYFDVTVFYYNPNISEKAEFDKRVSELKRFVREADLYQKPEIIVGEYEPDVFEKMAEGLENEPERGKRCYECYKLRLKKTAEMAAKLGMDYYTTTLSISPLKNSEWINAIGEELAGIWGVSHLPSDFKKKEGYKRSIQLSEKYHLYRQNFCGCRFSKKTAVSD